MLQTMVGDYSVEAGRGERQSGGIGLDEMGSVSIRTLQIDSNNDKWQLIGSEAASRTAEVENAGAGRQISQNLVHSTCWPRHAGASPSFQKPRRAITPLLL